MKRISQVKLFKWVVTRINWVVRYISPRIIPVARWLDIVQLAEIFNHTPLPGGLDNSQILHLSGQMLYTSHKVN